MLNQFVPVQTTWAGKMEIETIEIATYIESMQFGALHNNCTWLCFLLYEQGTSMFTQTCMERPAVSLRTLQVTISLLEGLIKAEFKKKT